MRCFIILSELIAFFYFNSSSLLMDGLSSLIDVLASVLLILFIYIADRPPDRNHPFGHGRFEPIAGLQMGIFLIVLGVIMGFYQFSSIDTSNSTDKVVNPYASLVSFGALIILEICYRFLKFSGRKRNSPALLADAVHYRIDALNSLFATIALFLGVLWPEHSYLFDKGGAIVIALLMIVIGSYAAKENLNQLLDKVPDQIYFDKVKKAALAVPLVENVANMKLQVYGPDAHVSIDIQVPPKLSVLEAHNIAEEVKNHIQTTWPQVIDVIVHIEPHLND
ncbi:MAG: cation diffusion facilitator family transporter [Rhabdochlamydiaceae bacterium]